MTVSDQSDQDNRHDQQADSAAQVCRVAAGDRGEALWSVPTLSSSACCAWR